MPHTSASSGKPALADLLRLSLVTCLEGIFNEEVFIAASFIALSAASGGAADMATQYTKAPAIAEIYDWTGFYVGLKGAGGWGSSSEYYAFAPNTAGFLGTQKYDVSGWMAGGYNCQSGAFVFGVEADHNWSNIGANSPEINAGLGDTYYTNVKSYGDVKGRVGWTTNGWETNGNRLLLYVDGGVAFGQVDHHYDAAMNVGASTFQATASRTGWTVGAGLEYMFTQNWTDRLEFDWVDLGTSRIRYSPDPTDYSNWQDTFGVVKVGVNYKFGGPLVAKY